MKIEEKIKELVEGGLFYCVDCRNFSEAVYETRNEVIEYEVRKTSSWNDVEYEKEDCIESEHIRTDMECGCEVSASGEELLVFYDEVKKIYTCKCIEGDEEEIEELNKALKEHALKNMKFSEVEV